MYNQIFILSVLQCITSFTLTLEIADRIANNVIENCKKHKFKPITVQVVGPAAEVIVRKTMDGSPIVGIPEIAQAKAYTCIATKSSSRMFREKQTGGEMDVGKFSQLQSMVTITGGKMAPTPGGVLIKSTPQGDTVGAVGVSGASGDEDEYCALMGIIESEIEGIETVPRDHQCETCQTFD